MTKLTDEAVKALLDGATPGPWRADGEPWNRVVWSSADNRVCFMAHSNGLDDERDIATSNLAAAEPGDGESDKEDLASYAGEVVTLRRTVIALHAQLADAKAAQALVVERAAEAVKSLWKWDDEGWQVERPSQPQAEAAIRALADADGLAAVDALRKERDLAVAQNDRLWAANHKLVAAQDAAEADRDRLAAANAALEAQVARLVGAIGAEARRYAGFYPLGSDGQNTFVMFAEWVENRAAALAEVQADARREGGE